MLSRCLLASGATIVTGTIDVPGFRVESYHCQIGTDSNPDYQMEIQDSRGKISANTAKYRDYGVSDSDRPGEAIQPVSLSWDFDTTVGLRGYPGHALEGPAIESWTEGDGTTQHTYRVSFASDAEITDAELWMELEGPNDAAANSLAAIKTTRCAPLGTPAAYPTDSGSTWTGTGVGTKQYMQIQYTPDKAGIVRVRVFMAKASDNIYVDPKIQIDQATSYVVSGTVYGYTGDGSGLTVEVWNKDKDWLEGVGTTTAGGNYSVSVRTNETCYAVVRQDGSHVGRSDDLTPV